jgi:Peptidase family S41
MLMITKRIGVLTAGCAADDGPGDDVELGPYPDHMATIRTTPDRAASTAPAPELTTVTEVVTRLAAWLRRLPPPQERIDRLLAELEERFAGRAERITADGCAEIERVAWPYSRHLLLQYDPDGVGEPDEEDPGWPEPDPEAILPRAAQVQKVSRLDSGACLIRIDGFESLSIAQPYLDAAFTLARGATGIVLDLRANAGGNPETVAYLAGRLLGDKAVELSEVTYRDHRRQWWTPDLPTGTAVPADMPVAVLVSERTFSSGEALAYHLQARGRVTIVGERTPGAADHVTDIRLAATVTGELPIGYCTDSVTGTNWEGRGVAPQVACPAADAIDAALAHLQFPRRR